MGSDLVELLLSCSWCESWDCWVSTSSDDRGSLCSKAAGSKSVVEGECIDGDVYEEEAEEKGSTDTRWVGKNSGVEGSEGVLDGCNCCDGEGLVGRLLREAGCVDGELEGGRERLEGLGEVA